MRANGRRSRHLAHVAFASFMLAGCATDTAVSLVKPTPLHEALAMTQGIADSAYTITEGDDITIRFYYNPQLDEDLRVRPDGKISLALVGEIDAARKTPQMLSESITTAYKAFLTRPNAVVILRRVATARAFVGGEVARPALLDMQQRNQTVLQGIAATGGVTTDATLKQVIVLRRIPDRPLPIVFAVDLTKALDGTDPAQDVTLLPDDVVYVPRSGIADINLAMRLYIFNNLNLSTSASIGRTLP